MWHSSALDALSVSAKDLASGCCIGRTFWFRSYLCASNCFPVPLFVLYEYILQRWREGSSVTLCLLLCRSVVSMGCVGVLPLTIVYGQPYLDFIWAGYVLIYGVAHKC